MWPFDQLFGRRQQPTTDTITREQFSAASVITEALTSLRNLPDERVSRDEAGTLGILQHLEDTLAGYPNDTRPRIIRVLRMLAGSDDDVGGSLRDLQALASTPIRFEINAGARATKQASEELDRWAASVWMGGLDSLSDNLVREAYLAGATSVEWVPNPTRTGIMAAEVVPPETIRIRRDPDTQLLEFRQTGVAERDLELDPRTYVYVPLDTDANSPYGIPAIVTALKTLSRKADLMDGEDRLISAASKLALVTAAVKAPDPMSFGLQSTKDPAYREKVAEYTRQVAKLIASGSEAGLYTHPDTVEVKATNFNQSLSGTDGITDRNQRLVWSGLGTVPFLRGDMGANYALAKVVWPTMMAFAMNVQKVVRANLEHGANLHLRLMGIPATASVLYEDPPNPFQLEEQQVDQARVDVDERMLALVGEAWIPRMAARWDLSEGEIKEALEAKRARASTPPPPAPESGSNGELEEEETMEESA